ncbi:hypothetical protein [Micromonospora sp. NPDC047730]|uniref:hypothetical protein n=1 Tax=Micromonospora sp. NPDC047730 TaxID=3364253 RepID=UPI003718E7C5
MTAAGKITAAALAARVAAGDPVRVLLVREDAEWAARCGRVTPRWTNATRKTGVETLTVTATEVTMHRGGGRRAERLYAFETGQGRTLNFSPAQTFILAPEDAAAVKRAHVEALAMDAEREAAKKAAEVAELKADPEIFAEGVRLAKGGFRDPWVMAKNNVEARRAQAAHERRQRDAVGAVPAFTAPASAALLAEVGSTEGACGPDCGHVLCRPIAPPVRTSPIVLPPSTGWRNRLDTAEIREARAARQSAQARGYRAPRDPARAPEGVAPTNAASEDVLTDRARRLTRIHGVMVAIAKAAETEASATAPASAALVAEVAPAEAPAVPAETIATREAWLVGAVNALRPLFAEHTVTLPTVRVSVGWPGVSSRKGLTKVIGQCWASFTTADKTPQVFISPALADAGQVLETLVHELIHAWDDCKSGHKGDFAKLAKRVGLTGKMTATVAGDDLKAKLAEIAAQLGEYPHAKLSAGVRDGQGEKKQTTRMLKVECPDSGYTARTTRKWLDEVGAPICPCHKREMSVA